MGSRSKKTRKTVCTEQQHVDAIIKCCYKSYFFFLPSIVIWIVNNVYRMFIQMFKNRKLAELYKNWNACDDCF